MTGVIFIAGFIIGSGTGVFLHAMILNSKNADNRMHEFFEKKDKGTRKEKEKQNEQR